MYFDSSSCVFYIFDDFNVFNETGLGMIMYSGKKMSKVGLCYGDKTGTIFSLHHKYDLIFAGVFLRKSSEKFNLDIDKNTRMTKIGFPKKLDHNIYSKIKGGNGDNYFCYDLLLSPFSKPIYLGAKYAAGGVRVLPRYVISNDTRMTLQIGQSEKHTLEIRAGQRMPVIWRTKESRRIAFKPLIFDGDVK
jgi:hypothetical protein